MERLRSYRINEQDSYDQPHITKSYLPTLADQNLRQKSPVG